MACPEVALAYNLIPINLKELFGADEFVPDGWRNIYRTAEDTLKSTGIDYCKLDSRQIKEGELSKGNYKILVLPYSDRITPPEADRIREFADSGGKVITVSVTDCVSGIFKGTVSFHRHFWRWPDRVTLLKNVVSYLLSRKMAVEKTNVILPQAGKKSLVKAGYHICPDMAIDIALLRRYNLAPDIVVVITGHNMPGDKEGIQYVSSDRLITACKNLKEQGIYFILWSEGNPYLKEPFPWGPAKNQGKDVLPYSRDVVARIRKVSGKHFLGYVQQEPGSGQIIWNSFFSDASDMKDAKEKYVKELSKWVNYSKNLGIPHIYPFEITSLHRYNYNAGIDKFRAEAAYGYNLNVQLSSVRGAARVYKKQWSVDISLWEGEGDIPGCFRQPADNLWWSFYLSYIYGADPIMVQSNGIVMGAGKILKEMVGSKKSLRVEKYEQVYMDFYKFVHTHPRLGRPQIKIAFFQGNLDAWANYGNEVWGLSKIKKWQRAKDGRWEFAIKGERPEWRYHDPEFGWDYLSVFYPGYTNGNGKDRYFSGTPYGQIDITPIEAPLSILKKYSCLILTGWNTMTSEIYQKLKDYCKQGGCLLLAIPHLSTHIKREDAINGNYTFLKKGDFSDFMGIKVKGKGEKVGRIAFKQSSDYNFPAGKSYFAKGINLARIELTTAKVAAGSLHGPVLTENNIGKGKVFLLAAWNYPGAKGLHSFMKDLIKHIAVNHQGDVKISGSQEIAYSLYQDKHGKTIYLVNTNKKPQTFYLHSEKRKKLLRMKERSIKIVKSSYRAD